MVWWHTQGWKIFETSEGGRPRRKESEVKIRRFQFPYYKVFCLLYLSKKLVGHLLVFPFSFWVRNKFFIPADTKAVKLPCLTWKHFETVVLWRGVDRNPYQFPGKISGPTLSMFDMGKSAVWFGSKEGRKIANRQRLRNLSILTGWVHCICVWSKIRARVTFEILCRCKCAKCNANTNATLVVRC